MVFELGVYVFIWSFQNGGGVLYFVQLMINLEEWGVVYVYFIVISWMQSLSVVVVYVNKGDDVFVKMLEIS